MHRLRCTFVVVGCLACLVCGAGCTDYGSGEDGDGGRDAQVDDADGGGEADLVCAYGDAFVVQFDKSCSGDDDCALVTMAYDCCGTGYAVGLRRTEQERFEVAWKSCLGQLAQCGCPSGMPRAEDGSTADSFEAFRVRCQNASCSTYLP